MTQKRIGNKVFDKDSMLLYAVTDRQWLEGRTLEAVVEQALKTGVTFLQLREKNMTHEELVAEGRRIKKLADKYNVPFVINDDIYVAKEIDADGVHIGQSDMEYEKARQLLGDDKIIGVTAPTLELAKKAQEAGADYIKTSTGFGGAGATFADIELFSGHIGPNVKMKAAGGISSLEDAEKFLALGADRLGTSRIIKIVKNEKATGY